MCRHPTNLDVLISNFQAISKTENTVQLLIQRGRLLHTTKQSVKDGFDWGAHVKI